MIDYYSVETSPRKVETEYDNIRTKVRKTRKLETVKTSSKKKVKTNTKTNVKKNTIKILDVAVCFAILLVISYRYALINSSFEEKEKLKKNFASITKQNEQLKVSIEQQMNVNAIAQQAKEKLGMQKLDNNQKVYVNLEKSDYIESASQVETTGTSTNQTWWSKLLKDLFNVK